MEKDQESEWLEAQKIVISEDLVSAAKRQLEFLAAVDRRQRLYDGLLLDRAIYRYKGCWLPLLAKHTESGVVEGPLVVPLDCEWIWHCHRLNPVQYRKDCEQVFGRILSNQNVESSVQGKSKHQTAKKWAELYPDEPFEVDASNPSSVKNADMYVGAVESITYDLVSAVKRQSSFYYQVSRASMHEDCFLKEAVARYKGFLHLIRRNQERSMKCFRVPTYDIDLIWHSHQLHPLSYCNDMVELLGRVLEHDDTDSDRTKGKRLDVGFSETTKQWENTYGLQYWRAGAMYRGNMPSPLAVLLEVVAIRNLPASHQNGNFFVSFSKKQPDSFFTGSGRLCFFSESGKKQIAGFKCEPTGELILTLMSNSTSDVSSRRPANIIGTTSMSLQDLTNPDPNLSVEKWFDLKPHSGHVDSKPVCLHVAASFTVPIAAPHQFHMVRSPPFCADTCFFPLPGKTEQIKCWTPFMDDNGNEVNSVRMRNYKKTIERNNSVFEREVVGVTRLSGNPRLLAEYAENKWSLNDSNLSFGIEKITNQNGHILELNDERQIRVFLGKKLEYEPRNCKEQPDHHQFITAVVVEFCPQNPYGKAVALFDMKSKMIEVSEDWFVLLGIVLAFILADMLKKEENSSLMPCENNVNEKLINSDVEVGKQNSEDKMLNYSLTLVAIMTEAGTAATPTKSSGCGSGCGSKSGAAEKAGGCGSGCGGSCGNALSGENSGGCGRGCGGGCGGGCGSVRKSSGCGSGCGGGCGGGCGNGLAGNKSSGCGSGCGGGCGGGCGNGLAGNKSSGCGSGCGGGCGAEVTTHEDAVRA